jgi:hypothetical protein
MNLSLCALFLSEPVVLCSYLDHIWILVVSYSEPGLEERSAVSQLKNHLREIIEIEWDIINDLKKELAKTTETTKITRLSNSIALHAATLNKLIQATKNETITDETTLEQLIAQLPKKYRTKFHRRIKKCTQNKPS